MKTPMNFEAVLCVDGAHHTSRVNESTVEFKFREMTGGNDPMVVSEGSMIISFQRIEDSHEFFTNISDRKNLKCILSWDN